MKALIRNNGETVLETAGIEGIDWITGAPLTNPAWAGGPYALCADCPVTDPEPGDFDITEEQVPIGEPGEDGEQETIGRRIATFNSARYEARRAQEESAPEEQEAPAPESPQEAPEGAQEDGVIIIDGVEYRRA